MRHIKVPGYVAKIFRRTYAEATGPGSIWEKTFQLYTPARGRSNETSLTWEFDAPEGFSQIGLGHMKDEKDRFSHMGAEYAMIGLDELTRFLESQFWFITTRNRSTCGVKPYIRATCNPDPDHFVKSLIRWWLDDKGQFPDLSKSGIVRYMLRLDGAMLWYDESPERFREIVKERRKDDPHYKPYSISFIPASLDDNPALLKADPGYKSKLMDASLIERQRLLYGDWLIRESAGNFFKRQWFNFRPHTNNLDIVKIARYWDRAATEAKKGNDPDYTAGCLMARLRNGQYIVLDMVRFRGTPLEVENRIIATAKADAEAWGNVEIGIEQDPGQAGKFEGAYYTRALAGFVVKLHPAKQSKVKRAEPVSAQCEAGNVIMLQANWNEPLITELEAFPEGGHDDQVDALSGAFSVVGINKDNFSGWV